MNTVEKGRIAEAKVVAVLVAQGIEVFLPVFGNGTCDLIASTATGLVRVEAKYVTGHGGIYEAALRQTRHNRSGVLNKGFSACNADVLAIYVSPLDRVAFLPAAPLDGRNTITLRADMLDAYVAFAGAQSAPLPIPRRGNQFTVCKEDEAVRERPPA